MSDILEAVKLASEKWKSSFNNGDATGCAAQYEENAIMHARPFGNILGEIKSKSFGRN